MNKYKIEMVVLTAFILGIVLTSALNYWGIIHLPQRLPEQSANPLDAEAKSLVDAVRVAKQADLKKLEGAYCIERGGTTPTCLRMDKHGPSQIDPVATDTFLRLFWKKVPDELKAETLKRMQIMPPFEEGSRWMRFDKEGGQHRQTQQTPGLMQSLGCVFLKCRSEQVGFYFELATGATAFTLRRKGACEPYSDIDFKSQNKLCTEF